jgi:hypothetical protein
MNVIFKRERTVTKIDWLLISLLAVHFFIMHSWLPGYVLCIGTDGHVAVESSADQANCNDPESLPSYTESDVSIIFSGAFAAKHCGPCVDLTLFSGCDDNAPNQQKNSALQILLSPVNGQHSYQLSATEDRREIPAFDFKTISNPSLISLQTIVLLI